MIGITEGNKAHVAFFLGCAFFFLFLSCPFLQDFQTSLCYILKKIGWSACVTICLYTIHINKILWKYWLPLFWYYITLLCYLTHYIAVSVSTTASSVLHYCKVLIDHWYSTIVTVLLYMEARAQLLTHETYWRPDGGGLPVYNSQYQWLWSICQASLDITCARAE